MTEPHNTKWLSYQQASEWAQSQNIMTCDQWAERYSAGLPEGVPEDPQTVYGNEFVGWHEFLGVQLSRDGRKVFWSYERARDWARSAGIKSGAQWEQKSKDKVLPIGVPAQPYKVYKGKFKNWGDFLGTGHVATKDKHFITYEEAKHWARRLNIKNMVEWKEKRKTLGSEGIPANPDRVYKEFVNWGDFLGTGRVANKDREFLSYEEVSAWAQEEGIKTQPQWVERAKKGLPSNIPAYPNEVYEGLFKHWSEFLGTGKSLRQVYSSSNRKISDLWEYDKVLQWARDEGITTSNEWVERCKMDIPDGVPRRPHVVYKEFINWNDFLGTPQIFGTSKIERILRYILEDIFDDHYTHKKTPVAFDLNGKKHKIDVLLEKNGIIVEYDGAHWHKDKSEYDAAKSNLLRETKDKFKVVRVRVKPLELLDKDWDVSIDGSLTYAQQISRILCHLLKLNHIGKFSFSDDVMVGFSKWNLKNLETTNFREILEKYDGYGSYSDASEFAKKLNIRTRSEWEQKHSEGLIQGFPFCPQNVYQPEFKSWGDFLGTGKLYSKNREFLCYPEASAWVISEGIKTSVEWWERCKKGLPENIPTNPCMVYGQIFKENAGWYGFLGKTKPLPTSKKKSMT